MIGKMKIRLWLYLDRRIDNLLRRDAMKKGISKSDLVRKIVNQHYINEGVNINDVLNQIP